MTGVVVHEDKRMCGTANVPWRIGGRSSLPALIRAGVVRDALAAAGQQAEPVVVRTACGKSQDSVQKIDVDVFITALRDELAAGTVDIAVHLYKDLPDTPDPRFIIAAIPPCEELSLRECAVINGSSVIRASAVGPLADAAELGCSPAREFLELGTRALLIANAAASADIPQAVNPPTTDSTTPSPMENNR
jgi:hydroxymethylbilane synthase